MNCGVCPMRSRARAPNPSELRPRPPLRHTFLSSTWTLYRLLSHIRCLGVEDRISCPSTSPLRTCDPSYHASRPLPHLEFLNAFSSLESCPVLPSSRCPTNVIDGHCWLAQTQIIATTPLLTMGNA